MSIAPAALREFLIDRARRRQRVTYGEALTHFGHAVHQANINNLLKRPLKHVGEDCNARGEPLLTVLVVSKATGQPSAGFIEDAARFGILPATVTTEAERQAYVGTMTARCFHHWQAA